MTVTSPTFVLVVSDGDRTLYTVDGLVSREQAAEAIATLISAGMSEDTVCTVTQSQTLDEVIATIRSGRQVDVDDTLFDFSRRHRLEFVEDDHDRIVEDVFDGMWPETWCFRTAVLYEKNGYLWLSAFTKEGEPGLFRYAGPDFDTIKPTTAEELERLGDPRGWKE